MKVIFLDCDGVINGYGLFTEVIYSIAQKLHLIKLLRKHHNIFGVHKHKIKLLAKIVKKTNAKIVLSSSWRLGWELIEDGKCIPNTDTDKLLCKELSKYGIEIYSRTKCLDTTKSLGRKYSCWREDEINEWLFRHPQVTNFVVLDDEQTDLQSFVGRELIQTSDSEYICGNWKENTGLKRKHVKQAIKILNKRE